MPRVISILSTMVAFGAVLAYALWPSTRPRAAETHECADSSAEEAVLQAQAQVEELEAARRRLEIEVQGLRQLLSHEQDEPRPDPPAPATPMHIDTPRSRPLLDPFATLTHEQRMTSARRRNGELFREAGLSPDQIQALLPVLALQEERVASRMIRPEEVGRRVLNPIGADAMLRDHEELVQAIGQDKATQFESLRKTLGSRAELRRVRDELEQAGEPLSDEQRQKLLARMSSRQPITSLPPNPDRNTAMARFQETDRQRSEQLRTEMAPVLSPEQLQLFDQGQELRKAYQRPPSPSFQAQGAAGSAAPTR